jgi:hypothetical protein
MSRPSQDIDAFGKRMLDRMQPFRADAHCRNQIGRLRKFISSTAFPVAMSFLWTMSRHLQLYEIVREAQRPQRKERFKLAWPVQVPEPTYNSLTE